MHQHSDGRLFLWTDDHFLVEIAPAKVDATQLFIDKYISDVPLDDALRTKLADTVASCMTCHSFRPDVHRAGPALGAVAGARLGSTNWDRYSMALKGADGEWSQDRLAAYINSPSNVVEGTSMPNPGVSDPVMRVEIAKLLLALREYNE